LLKLHNDTGISPVSLFFASERKLIEIGRVGIDPSIKLEVRSREVKELKNGAEDGASNPSKKLLHRFK
jgi:hypothetical protein